MKMYRIMINGMDRGPFTEAYLRDMWSRGEVNRNTLYWQERVQKWVPLGPHAADLGFGTSIDVIKPYVAYEDRRRGTLSGGKENGLASCGREAGLCFRSPKRFVATASSNQVMKLRGTDELRR
jgi:hypothetical protein